MKLTLTLLSAFSILTLASSAEPERPNLVLILTDDMGYADLPAFGESEIPTPHLDQLCKEGAKLTNAYVSAPICVPSRMGLLTGRYQQRFGIYDNVYSPEENRLWVQETTLADVLKAAGYRTGLVGKWHLSGNSGVEHLPPPHKRGFDEFVGIGGGMGPFWKGSPLLRLVNGTYEPFKAPEYLTDFFGHEAEAFVERHQDHPFFLYLAFNAPHAPLHGLEEDQAAIDTDWISPDRRIYDAMVRTVDRNVGRVMKSLEKHGLAGNTLVVFLNDNRGGGGNNAAEHTRNTARNEPLREHKFDVLEGGIRVPMIVRWPGKLPPGKTFTGLSSSLDVFPTMLAAAGVEHPQGRHCDGVDLLPFLAGKAPGEPHDFLCWQQKHWARPNERKTGESGRRHQFAIRSDYWKAVKLDQTPTGSPNRAWELYDMRRDPGELQDVATEYPETVKQLARTFTTWQQDMHPMIPPPQKPPKD
jgi:arylsulfatase A-like enzyme